ncbi:MAG: phytoene desaturase [Gammaproteobacteria bacterium]|nr:phytoene desaturase [Gammaproteobacteria bacterium]
MRPRRVVVVGAGMGGLATALDLSRQGIEVLVLERAPRPGGKVREVSVGGARMDAGPSVFTMRRVFEELFEDAGARLDACLKLQPAEILARHAWDRTGHLDLFADIERSGDAIGRFAGAAEHRGYRAFCERARDIYQALEAPFLRSSRPSPMSLAARAGLRGLPALARISPFTTLWKELGRYFRDPRLHQLFGRYATYCGSSPWLAPATLMLVAHVEQEGVWLVDGGMHRLAEQIEALATRHGAVFRYGSHVDDILVRDGRATGVRLANGEVVAADAIVFNGDCAALAHGLLGHGASAAVEHQGADARSLSALALNVHARVEGFPLSHHTVFFSDDYAAEFDDIRARGRLPAAPTVYLCAQDRPAHDAPPPGDAERLLCIVNAPPLADLRPLDPQEISTCMARTFERMAHCGLTLQPTAAQQLLTTPADFQALFPGTGGALYGRATHGWAASFSRPGARSRLPALYLAGGSTHPGPGMPMAALSGRQAAQSVLADLASTSSRFPRAMPGGISTP